jgi:hypothetical protein
VVPTKSAGTETAVVGIATSQRYDPDGGRPWPGRNDNYHVRVDVSDVRYTTVQRVRAALEAAGKTWAAAWTVTYVDLETDQLALLGCGFEDESGETLPNSALLPGEVPKGQTFTEGALRRVYVNAYERNDTARTALTRIPATPSPSRLAGKRPIGLSV